MEGWAVEGAVGSEYKIDATYLLSKVQDGDPGEIQARS